MRKMVFQGINYVDFLQKFDLSKLRRFPKYIDVYDKINIPRGKVLYLRHDIDGKIDASLHMAEIESSMGIQSNYYALHISNYWNEEGFHKLLKIQEMGHEVGFHNAIITDRILKTGKLATEPWNVEDYAAMMFETGKVLRELRDAGINVRGTCAHGHPTCISHNYSNIQLWKQYTKHLSDEFSLDLTSYGLEYDCNIVPRNGYFSDSGNQWSGNLGPDPFFAAKFFAEDNNTLMINIHPQWWL